jgi:hydrogenase maturation protease
MRTVILGLGNPILRDDAAGLEVVNQLQARLNQEALEKCHLELKTAAMGGLRILDQLTGCDRAIIVDAIMTGGDIGQVHKMKPEELRGELHASCVHDLSFTEALKLGHMMGMPLPADIIIYGIEVADPYTVKEGCSKEVLAGVRAATEMIIKDLMGIS